jgi:hypothetical protein
MQHLEPLRLKFDVQPSPSDQIAARAAEALLRTRPEWSTWPPSRPALSPHCRGRQSPARGGRPGRLQAGEAGNTETAAARDGRTLVPTENGLRRGTNKRMSLNRRAKCPQTRYPDPKPTTLHETGASPRPAIFAGDIIALAEAGLAQALKEHAQALVGYPLGSTAEIPDHCIARLLRPSHDSAMPLPRRRARR